MITPKVQYSLPLYLSVISRPMDFTIIQNKIDNKEYEKEKESLFWADLESIVRNVSIKQYFKS